MIPSPYDDPRPLEGPIIPKPGLPQPGLPDPLVLPPSPEIDDIGQLPV